MRRSIPLGEPIYAVINKSGQVQICGKQRWVTWWCLRGGERRSKIKRTVVGDRAVETGFTGCSRVPDGPPLFWLVGFYRYEKLRGPADSMSSAMFDTINELFANRCDSLDEAMHATGNFKFKWEFASLKEALAFHKLVEKKLRAHARLTNSAPEKSEQLLARLAFWCSQRWGRQAQVARAVGTTPQRVNDWLNGRKKMTGEQSLRLVEFIEKNRRSFTPPGG
jgi:hypothetical protein